jgi:site-specific DNA-methyltransferase (adenine-specific)
LTDPPYGVDYSDKNKWLNTIAFGNRITTPIENDGDVNLSEFYTKFLEIIPFSDYSIGYAFQLGMHIHEFRNALDSLKLKWGDYLVWMKQKFVFGRKDYKARHEFVVYFWKNHHKFYGPNNRSTLLEYDRPQKSELHPTMKPIALLAQLITDGSKKGMTVYDPFLGSGSTLIACEQLERQCYGMELDPFYVQVALDRFEKLTNIKPVKLK